MVLQVIKTTMPGHQNLYDFSAMHTEVPPTSYRTGSSVLLSTIMGRIDRFLTNVCVSGILDCILRIISVQRCSDPLWTGVVPPDIPRRQKIREHLCERHDG